MIRNIDRSGNILSTLTLVADAGNPLTIQNQTHEGITMDRDGDHLCGQRKWRWRYALIRSSGFIAPSAGHQRGPHRARAQHGVHVDPGDTSHRRG